jgi:hypothetical protein
MTDQAGPTEAARGEEIAEYLEAVRAATRDLPAEQRDELLDDLATHLAEVAAESPAPLRHRLGPPEEYAAELRAAAAGAPESTGVRQTIRRQLAAHWQRLQSRLAVLDRRFGPLLGYEQVTDYTRLLVPAWWLLRGYLAAMLLVYYLDYNGQVGLLPRLGGSTLAGLVILAVFIGGSIWLAHRSARWSRWPRRVLTLGSALMVLFGAIGFVALDDRQRYGVPGPYREVLWRDPYQDVSDIYVVDEHGQLLTNVILLDQNGRPINIGWCDERTWVEWEVEEAWRVGPEGEPAYAYPLCPDRLPWWLSVQHQPSPDSDARTEPAPSPPGPEPSPTMAPSPERPGDPVPAPTETVDTLPTSVPDATPEPTVAPTTRSS